MWEVLLEALIDTLKLFPILLISYILIEVVENKLSHKMTKKITSKVAPIAGAALGLVPQCGFSVVATDMFSKKLVSMGTLIAIFIATSDEAVPLILAQPDKIFTLLPLLLIKFVYACLMGFLVDLVYNKVKNKEQSKKQDLFEKEGEAESEADSVVSDKAHHEHDHDHEHEKESENIIGCCGHDIKEENKWKLYLLHPLLHSLKILLYIFILNVLLGTIIYFVGEESLASFLKGTSLLSVICSALVGLIPNCAASVVITELFLSSSLPFGALVAGLITNAGLAVVILFRNNKNMKENLILVGTLLVSAIVLGYLLLLLPESLFI